MKDIIAMAHEASPDMTWYAAIDDPTAASPEELNFLKRFAALVRADERAKFFTPEEARIALEDTDFTWHHSVTQDMVEKLQAIRARSNT